jgi:hypothetical protein
MNIYSVQIFKNIRQWTTNNKGVSHFSLGICITMYLKAKEELWKLKYFTMQKYNLYKIL